MMDAYIPGFSSIDRYVNGCLSWPHQLTIMTLILHRLSQYRQLVRLTVNLNPHNAASAVKTPTEQCNDSNHNSAESKKMIRYLDSRIVSTKGEKFTEIKKEDSEEMKKTYVHLKPARKYRFH
ncbi:hypothetical protein FSP39_007651 [Pinctada imbricata]|uniref:Uncharacterized protein n=1 Tax=Pinctada imbricata TaxID=66713 RepID=A0AA89BNX2_PINIB|nr:hypothetical protein FSP39_007651 [Pinctada imbricata]